MYRPATNTGPQMRMGGVATQGFRASQDILLHVLRANAEMLDTTRDLLGKIIETLEANRIDLPKRGVPEKVKVK